MRILVVSSKFPPEYAGSALRAHQTYKRLAQNFSLRYDVITSAVTTNLSRRYVFDGVSVKVIANKDPREFEPSPLKEYGFARLYRRLRGRIYQQRNYWCEALPMFAYLWKNGRKYDAIHVFGNNAGTSAAISYAKATGKPILVEIVNLTEDPHQYEPAPISFLWGKGFPAQTLLVCLSENLRQVCLQHGYSDQQIWCRPNPVDESRFNFEPDRLENYARNVYGLNNSDVMILHLAKFMPLKNQLFSVNIMSFLPDNFKLTLVGPLIESGPFFERDRAYYESVLNAIKRKGLENRIQVVPEFVASPEHYIKGADVLVLPSTTEAFGTPAIEALACGVPVVTGPIPDVFDQWIRPGLNGFICPFDHEAWAQKIMLAHRFSSEMMKRASERILDKASTKVIDQEYFHKLVACQSMKR